MLACKPGAQKGVCWCANVQALTRRRGCGVVCFPPTVTANPPAGPRAGPRAARCLRGVLRGVCTLVQNTFLLEVFARAARTPCGRGGGSRRFTPAAAAPQRRWQAPLPLQAGYHTPTTLPATLPTHCTPLHPQCSPTRPSVRRVHPRSSSSHTQYTAAMLPPNMKVLLVVQAQQEQEQRNKRARCELQSPT